MIGWEKRVLLRHYLEQVTKAAVAKLLGVSRRTVHYWIETEQLDRDVSDEAVQYGPRPSVPTKVDPYKGIILSRLAEYPALTAMRLFEEIKASGYVGCYTQVKEYVRKVRPRVPEEPAVRFETPPGHQGQVDFADFRLPWGKTRSWLCWGFRASCGCSSSLDRRCSMSSKASRRRSASLVVCLMNCCSGASSSVLSVSGRPYRAKTKGKVERPVSYVRSSLESIFGFRQLELHLISLCKGTKAIGYDG